VPVDISTLSKETVEELQARLKGACKEQ